MILSSRVYEVAQETPLQYATTLSTKLKNSIYLKREDLQPVFSFKIRGAYNKISHLTEKQREKGIVCCSAGNHAQGVALASTKLKVKAKIVMPISTPSIKVDAVRHHGGDFSEIILYGDNFDEAQAEARRLESEEGYTMIAPFDDPLVIAGQGTCGLEILKQSMGKDIDAIFICCGGGGLLAGIAAIIKRIRPEIKVIGVEAADAPGMTQSLLAGRVVSLPTVGLFADGAAVKTIGRETFRLCSQFVDDMIIVSTDEICAAIKDGFNDTRIVLEPAGALAIAGVKRYISKNGIVGKSFVATASGANMDFDRMRFVADRADNRETLISVKIPEVPGSFRQLYEQIFPRNVTEFSYRYQESSFAHIFLSFHAKNAEDASKVLDKLREKEYEVIELSDNEMAKVHARHLAGGRSPNVKNEVLYRFEFPEKPGALNLFLQKISSSWNVSLFHYRNHGADVGRVLVGLQIPPEEQQKFDHFLQVLGYTYFDETDNPVYTRFLL
uniref:Threonine dehydratase n=1 Tax=Arcella intermedia TaxID=1963864 RepID=A0A6B2L2A2_9EUKA